MNKLIFFFFALSFCTFSCQSDSNKPATSQATNKSTNSTAPISTTATTTHSSIVKLTCEMISYGEMNPKAAIYALVRENKIKIGEIVTGSCQLIPPEEYEDFKIPAEALAAAGGWWAGAGDYFYILEAETEYVVMKGVLDEMMEGDMVYERVAGLKK